MTEGRTFTESEAILAGADPAILEVLSLITSEVLETMAQLVSGGRNETIQRLKGASVKLYAAVAQLTPEQKSRLQEGIERYVATRPDGAQLRQKLQAIQTLSAVLPRLLVE